MSISNTSKFENVTMVSSIKHFVDHLKLNRDNVVIVLMRTFCNPPLPLPAVCTCQ